MREIEALMSELDLNYVHRTSLGWNVAGGMGLHAYLFLDR